MKIIKHVDTYTQYVFALFILIDMLTISIGSIQESQNLHLPPIVVPYIAIARDNFTVLWALVLIAILFLQLSYKGWVINLCYFGFFLFYRIITSVVQVTYLTLMGQGEIIRFGNYFLWGVELLIYLITNNSLNKDKDGFMSSYIFIVRLMIIVISLEVIFQALIGVLPKVPYISTWYKVCLRIPIGGSNSLAAMIVPTLVAILFQRDVFNLKKFIIIAVCSLAVFFTKSRLGGGCTINFFRYLSSS